MIIKRPSLKGLRLQTSTSTLIGGFAILVSIALASIFLYVSNHAYIAAVQRSQQIEVASGRLLVLVQDAETGQRGFLLTHNFNYLRPYTRGAAEAPANAATLEKLLIGNKPQLALATHLKMLVNAKLAELARTIAKADQNDFEGALAIVNDNSGNTYMADIRQDVEAIGKNEAAFREREARAANLTNTMSALLAVAGVFVVICLALYAIWESRESTKRLLAARRVLEETNLNLERIVDDRVGDLKVANEEVQRFAYIVSHDLRAPLVNVLGFTSELDAIGADLVNLLHNIQRKAPELVPPDQLAAVENDLPEALQFIRSSTGKMDRLINAILKLSREGQRRLVPEMIDVAQLVRAQANSLSQQLGARNAVISIDGALPNVESDRLATEQIFGNLIENAVKYLTNDRPGNIVVSGVLEGLFYRYTIADNGRGISSKDFERIFDLFRRSGEQNTPGEGIGLAYVRNLVRRLGGNISVVSELGTGSSFVVTLPVNFVVVTAINT